LRQVLTVIVQITGVHRAGNTIITGPVTGRVLANTVDTGIRGTADPVIAVSSYQAVHTLFMGLITHKGRCAGIRTVLTARTGIAGLCPGTVVTIVTEDIFRQVLTIIVQITGVHRAGNTIITD
jgi:hypothetical protein